MCANVGDSRAILGSLKGKNSISSLSANQAISAVPSHEANKTWVASALSRDHKPDAKDEKERII